MNVAHGKVKMIHSLDQKTPWKGRVFVNQRSHRTEVLKGTCNACVVPFKNHIHTYAWHSCSTRYLKMSIIHYE